MADKAARAALQAVAMDSTENNQRAQNTGPILSKPIIKQLTFDWSSKEKYIKLRNYNLEVKNMFENHSISQSERALVIKNVYAGKAYNSCKL